MLADQASRRSSTEGIHRLLGARDGIARQIVSAIEAAAFGSGGDDSAGSLHLDGLSDRARQLLERAAEVASAES